MPIYPESDRYTSYMAKRAISHSQRVWRSSILMEIEETDKPGYMKTPPEWCDDCVSAPGESCPICGCTHNC